MDLKEVSVTGTKRVGIPLAALNPDFDGDGKLDKDEKMLYDQLVAADADGTGELDAREFYTVLNSFVKVQHSLKNYKILAIFGLVMSLLLALSNLGTSAAVAVMSKDQYVNEQEGTNPMMTSSNGAVIATVNSQTKLPLYAAPVVPMAKLKSVESLEVSFSESSLSDGILDVKASLDVRDVKVYSQTRVVFELSSGGSVRIWDGDVTYVDATGDSKPLCAADMDCSAFTVDDVEQGEALLEEANAALAAIGVTVEGRRLDLASTCKEFARVVARKLMCQITGWENFCLGGDGGINANTAVVTPLGSSSFCTTLTTTKTDLTAQGFWCSDFAQVSGATCENSFTHYFDNDLGKDVYSPCGMDGGTCKLLTLESYFPIYILEFCDNSCITGPGGNCVNVFTQCCDYSKNCAPCSDVLS